MAKETKRKKEEVPQRVPPSQGYLVVDSKKCSGCQTCMMACSMVNEGEANTSLSRIQVVQDSFRRFPDDLKIYVCLQCVYAPCVEACDFDAMYIDVKNGNVRTIDQSECIGCMDCIQACPHKPHRTIFNPATKKAAKCDLCASAPYWDEQSGVNGTQACVESCPMKAIKLVKRVPNQQDELGYEVNLRNEHWEYIGLPVD